MKRTRKWGFVAQEAIRLHSLKLSHREIARRLGVSNGTVSRWARLGRLNVPGAVRNASQVDGRPQTPKEWAACVRAAFALDASDDQLVTLGTEVLLIVQDPTTATRVRLSAMGRFQALLKQLNLPGRVGGEEAVAPPPEAPKRAPRARPAGDPRRLLTWPSGQQGA